MKHLFILFLLTSMVGELFAPPAYLGRRPKTHSSSKEKDTTPTEERVLTDLSINEKAYFLRTTFGPEECIAVKSVRLEKLGFWQTFVRREKDGVIFSTLSSEKFEPGTIVIKIAIENKPHILTSRDQSMFFSIEKL